MQREIGQQFSVRYSFPVLFTRDAFDPGNPTLREVLHDRSRNVLFNRNGACCTTPASRASVPRETSSTLRSRRTTSPPEG